MSFNVVDGSIVCVVCRQQWELVEWDWTCQLRVMYIPVSMGYCAVVSFIVTIFTLCIRIRVCIMNEVCCEEHIYFCVCCVQSRFGNRCSLRFMFAFSAFSMFVVVLELCCGFLRLLISFALVFRFGFGLVYVCFVFVPCALHFAGKHGNSSPNNSLYAVNVS